MTTDADLAAREATPPARRAASASSGGGDGGRRELPPRLRRRRRRLLVASAPLVVLLMLLGVRLATLNLVHEQTLAAYEAGDAAGTLSSGERQGWVNAVERFRAPFAIGDGHVLAGRFDLARSAFEEALSEVPDGGIDECKVRVNLGLTYERLGDDAQARERPTEAQQFYEKGIRVTRERPPLCDAPEAGQGTGEELQDAQQRMEDKSAPPGGEPSESPGEQPAPTPPPVEPSPDPLRTPSQEQQDELERQQRENTTERNQRLDGQQSPPWGGGENTYPKPW